LDIDLIAFLAAMDTNDTKTIKSAPLFRPRVTWLKIGAVLCPIICLAALVASHVFNCYKLSLINAGCSIALSEAAGLSILLPRIFVNFLVHSIMCGLLLLTAQRDPDDESRLLVVKWTLSDGVKIFIAVATLVVVVLGMIIPDAIIFAGNGAAMKCTRAFTDVLYIAGPLIALPLSISSFIWVEVLTDSGKSSKEESQE
jgi:hypothetical protein